MFYGYFGVESPSSSVPWFSTFDNQTYGGKNIDLMLNFISFAVEGHFLATSALKLMNVFHELLKV